MFDLFIVRALLAGIGVAMIVGVLGCFVVWRKMAYFGDSLAHSSLLGIALGLLYQVNINVSIILVCTLFAVLLVILEQRKILATDSLLGILAHASLSIGMVVISLLKNQKIDLYTYLFGDILTVTNVDLYWIYGGGLLVLILLISNWSALVLITICQDLARAEGLKIFFMQLLLMFLMAMVVAVSIHIVGILLITSMMIIPAASARQFARSPQSMAIISSILGIIAVILGIFASLYFDTPSGPSIVVAAVVLFVLTYFVKAKNELKQ